MQSRHRVALIWQQRTLQINKWNRPRLVQSEAVLSLTHETQMVSWAPIYLQATVRKVIISIPTGMESMTPICLVASQLSWCIAYYTHFCLKPYHRLQLALHRLANSLIY